MSFFKKSSVTSEETPRTPLQEMLKNSLLAVAEIRTTPISELQKADRFAVRRYQNQRLRQTHDDLLQDPRFSDAARFFFEEVYTETVAAWRDQQAIKALPKVSKLMPMMALEPIALSMRLDYLTEKLDVEMAQRLRELQGNQEPLSFNHERYQEAYATAGSYTDRAEQIKLVSSVCIGLYKASSAPLVADALGAMAPVARFMGLGELQGFLERGMAAFKKLADPVEFAKILLDRELEVSNRIYGQYAAKKTAGATL